MSVVVYDIGLVYSRYKTIANSSEQLPVIWLSYHVVLDKQTFFINVLSKALGYMLTGAGEHAKNWGATFHLKVYPQCYLSNASPNLAHMCPMLSSIYPKTSFPFDVPASKSLEG